MGDLEAKCFESYQKLVYSRRTANNVIVKSDTTCYEVVWKPVVPFLGQIRKVYVAGDGVLDQMALEIIPGTDGLPLLYDYDLRMVESTRDISVDSVSGRNKGAVLIGAPRFLLNEAEHYRAVKIVESEVAGNSLGNMIDSDLTTRADRLIADLSLTRRVASCEGLPVGAVTCPLPGALDEIQCIQEILSRAGWQIGGPYEGEYALEEVVKHVRHPRVLHIATHGFVEKDDSLPIDQIAPQFISRADPMLRAGLLFAGVDRIRSGKAPLPGIENGILTALEMRRLDLKGTELVVLSACDTGLGKYESGEGVFGLRRALIEAGAQSILMSLWEVPDKATEELMINFYRNWTGGMDKREALRSAKMKLREDSRYDAPYYWGAFVLVGR